MTVLERVPLDQITREARDIHFTRTVLTVIAAVLFGLGWTAAKTFTAGWFTLAWCAAAVRVGWREGRKSSQVSRGPGRPG